MEDGLKHSLSSINTATQEPKPNCSSEAFKAHQDQQSLSLGPDDECDSSDKDVYPHATQNQLEFQVGNEAASNPGPAPEGEQDEPTQGSVDTDPNLSANQCEAEESDGSVPELVVTEAEESRRPAATLQRSERPPALVIPAAISITSLGSSADGGDMNCCDLLSPRSDSFSLTVSRRSEEDDTRSVAASSVMSLFHRVHMDPLEKDWLRSSARGNMTAQRLLLAQEPSLILKKTALHWAAKQGRQDTVDMMLRFGADVNVRSGYTALHLASIHGHQDIIQTLISTYNAKTNIRDYHGKMAIQYWSGCTDIFNQPDPQSAERFCRGQRTQRFALPSLRLSRSRSHGQLHLEFGTLPQSGSHDGLDLHV